MWFGWMTHLVKVVFISELATGVQNVTCPLKRFKDGLKASLGLCSIPTFGWETLATDHSAWRMTIHKGIQSFEEKWLHDLDQKHQACKKRRPDPSTAVACPQCGCICASNFHKILNFGYIRYKQNGILHMLDRNRRIKPHPERFQETEEEFDLVVTVEERVYDQVIELFSYFTSFLSDLNSRVAQSCSPVHVVNLDIQDNHEEATLGAFLICEMCQAIEGLDDLENEIDLVIPKLEKKWSRNLLHSVAFY
ncbi:RNA polymerase II subunit A C-terminal domain phosphatase SSU72 [Acropora cervicornis]|uniref:RNA polymerase II subunit A C-terminal domain phosphatase SSU72 n=1 Tax=Acropora cervicornis TaxID=6130 RepID=A0AAD9V165_ACRCE|nr:RNA polymerase II subunit A C-terminal domain phosphatase SSU72 [Acropora cervicornis]